MGLWGGSNASLEEQEMAIAEKIARQEEIKAKFKAGAQPIQRAISPDARYALGKNVGQAALAGMQQPVSFSNEQQMLGQMFGQGEKIWGTNNNPVTINNDLNSSRSDPFDETSSMFGFGQRGERSGLF